MGVADEIPVRVGNSETRLRLDLLTRLCLPSPQGEGVEVGEGFFILLPSPRAVTLVETQS